MNGLELIKWYSKWYSIGKLQKYFEQKILWGIERRSFFEDKGICTSLVLLWNASEDILNGSVLARKKMHLTFDCWLLNLRKLEHTYIWFLYVFIRGFVFLSKCNILS